jgi:tRNA(His) 5'-end guanylyltransferase
MNETNNLKSEAMANKKDSLGDRMKEFYENRTRNLLPRRTYTVIRVDGKAFHTYTRGLERPFDAKLIADMDATACYMCENIQGAKLAFVQSDEISIVLTDFDKLGTNAWFDGNIQKMASISASLATAKFNELRPNKLALFDSRVFTIPTAVEVENYLIWRQQDTTRNSISSVAQYLYSPRELHGKDTGEMQEMCFQKGINWNDYEPKLKRGRLIVKEAYDKNGAQRTRWVSTAPPIFTQERELLAELIPNNFEKVEAGGAF